MMARFALLVVEGERLERDDPRATDPWALRAWADRESNGEWPKDVWRAVPCNDRCIQGLRGCPNAAFIDH